MQRQRDVLFHGMRASGFRDQMDLWGRSGGAGKSFFQLAIILANATKTLFLKRYEINYNKSLSRSKSCSSHFGMYILGTG